VCVCVVKGKQGRSKGAQVVWWAAGSGRGGGGRGYKVRTTLRKMPRAIHPAMNAIPNAAGNRHKVQGWHMH